MLIRVSSRQSSRRDDDLMDTISRVGHLLEQRMDQALSAVGLTARQHRALLHISETPGLSRGSLGRFLRVSPQAAGTLSRRLRDAGLIDYDEADPGLPVSFTITESGRQRILQATPIVSTTGRSVLSQMPTVTVELLIDAMNDLARQID